MTDLNIPHAFASGTTISSSDMNANFDAIETIVNTTGVPKVQDSTITSAKIVDGTIATGDIADSAVSSAKIAPDAVQAKHLGVGSCNAVTLTESSANFQVFPHSLAANVGCTLPDASIDNWFIIANCSAVAQTISAGAGDTIAGSASISLASGSTMIAFPDSGSSASTWNYITLTGMTH